MLAVLDKDYLTVPSDELGMLTSLLTMVGGRVVHAEGPFAALGRDRRLSIDQRRWTCEQ